MKCRERTEDSDTLTHDKSAEGQSDRLRKKYVKVIGECDFNQAAEKTAQQ